MHRARRCERIFLFADVAVRPNQKPPRRFAAKVFNISKAGAGVFSRQHFAPGEIVGMELTPPARHGRGRTFVLYGTVRRSEVGPEGNVLGIEFVLGENAGDYESFSRYMDERLDPPGAAHAGFTLIEACIAMTIVCLLATMGIPLYTRAVEQSRLDVASAKLRTIWSAERVYWLERRSFTSSMTTLNSMDLLDPSLLATAGPPEVVFTYQIVWANDATFQARAVRTGSRSWTGSIEIDQTGRLTGAVTGPDGQRLVPVP